MMVQTFFMKSFLLAVAFVLQSRCLIAGDSLFSVQPFEGKVRLSNIGLFMNEDGSRMVNVMQSEGFRKLIVVAANNTIEKEWYYVFRTKKGLPSAMPTTHNYNKINMLVADAMKVPAIHSGVSEKLLTEVFTTDLTNFIITRTDWETGAFRDETIYMNPKEYALTSFLDKGTFYVLALNPDNNFFTLYSSGAKTGIRTKKIIPDFTEQVNAGYISAGDASFPSNLFPLEYSKQNPARAYSYLTVPGSFLPFEKNTSAVKFSFENNELSFFSSLKNGHILHCTMSVTEGTCKTNLLTCNMSMINTALGVVKSDITTADALLSVTLPKTIAQTDSILIVARTRPGGTVVLMYYSLITKSQQHIDYFSTEHPSHLGSLQAKPGTFYTNRSITESKTIDKFLRFASADASSLAINTLRAGNGQLYISLEAIDGRVKFTDVAGAVVSVAAIMLPVPGGGSLASAFINGAIVGAAGEAIGGALSSINNPKMFFTGWTANTSDLRFVSNELPMHADFDAAKKIDEYIAAQPVAQENKLVAAAKFQNAFYVAVYNADKAEYKLVKFSML